MTARTLLEDLAALRDLLADGSTLTGEEQARLVDWVEQAIRVRVAQRTRSGTRRHAELMAAYWALVDRWRQLCEAEAAGYPGDVAGFRARHPMPTFKAFLRASRATLPAGVCPLCGAPQEPADGLVVAA